VLVPGYRTLTPGQSVTFEYEPGDQDGYDFRATEVWPAGREPVRSPPDIVGPSAAYRSALTITLDSNQEPEPQPEHD
jgi:CspA family cold shock protein